MDPGPPKRRVRDKTEGASHTPTAVFVVPCFNEARRLETAPFLELAASVGVRLLFVNDGSTDATEAVLHELIAKSEGQAELLTLARNSGKAEAVRLGMQRAAKSDADFVGFADSDLATPIEELLRLVAWVRERNVPVVIAARVGLAGTRIDRKMWRHYAGRLFATAASVVLRARIYDTQCGAKIFRNTPLLRATLAEPFRSSWIFDVELIGRLIEGTATLPGLGEAGFVEMPLRRWQDVAGSKLRASSWIRAALDLGIIAVDLAQRRRLRR